jgi:hypothetical protein
MPTLEKKTKPKPLRLSRKKISKEQTKKNYTQNKREEILII